MFCSCGKITSSAHGKQRYMSLPLCNPRRVPPSLRCQRGIWLTDAIFVLPTPISRALPRLCPGITLPPTLLSSARCPICRLPSFPNGPLRRKAALPLEFLNFISSTTPRATTRLRHKRHCTN
ncbi:hypothetical protein TRVL_10229 [Trypanosoma vivax]|nr:hypothetical protein TRVL_10229 [Trypanosoma vivax]